LPTTYTLQSQYLARRPIQRNPLKDLAILLTGLSGYAIFRIVNHQKHIFRRTKGNCKIWGATPKYINCVYKTADGSVHKNMLLCSGTSPNNLPKSNGWTNYLRNPGAWGVVRHANYVGDLILSYSMCAVCGFNSLIPWSYAIFMTLILVHRCHRDEKRCLNKYGESWRKYCEVVRWKLVPGIY
jgi:7-dehydrocholesterol reductase